MTSTTSKYYQYSHHHGYGRPARAAGASEAHGARRGRHGRGRGVPTHPQRGVGAASDNRDAEPCDRHNISGLHGFPQPRANGAYQRYRASRPQPPRLAKHPEPSSTNSSKPAPFLPVLQREQDSRGNPNAVRAYGALGSSRPLCRPQKPYPRTHRHGPESPASLRQASGSFPTHCKQAQTRQRVHHQGRVHGR